MVLRSFIVVLAISFCIIQVLAQNNNGCQKSTETDDQFINKIIGSLDKTNSLRIDLERGYRGNGIHYSWMDEMKGLNIKQVGYVFRFEWNENEVKNITIKKVQYYSKYYEYTSAITNDVVLEKVKSSGLEETLEKAAIDKAIEFLKKIMKGEDAGSSGTVYINMLDDERLPVSYEMPVID